MSMLCLFTSSSPTRDEVFNVLMSSVKSQRRNREGSTPTTEKAESTIRLQTQDGVSPTKTVPERVGAMREQNNTSAV